MILTGMRARRLFNVSLEILKVSKQLGTFSFKSSKFLQAIRRWEGSVRKKFESAMLQCPGVVFC